LLYTSSYDGLLKLWDLRTSTCEAEWKLENPIEDFVFIDQN